MSASHTLRTTTEKRNPTPDPSGALGKSDGDDH